MTKIYIWLSLVLFLCLSCLVAEGFLSQSIRRMKQCFTGKSSWSSSD